MPDYEPLTSDGGLQLAVCTLCACVVPFDRMSIHTRWHEQRVEPVETPAKAGE